MRQPSPSSSEPIAKGVLLKEIGAKAFDFKLYKCNPLLDPWVEFYWSVS